MSTTIDVTYQGPYPLYAIIRRESDAAAANVETQAVEAWDDAHRAAYAIALDDVGGDLRRGNWPAWLPPGEYRVFCYEQSGTDPSGTDLLLVTTGTYFWNGTSAMKFEASRGDGDVPVDHNTGGEDNYRIVDPDGFGIDGAIIVAYRKPEYLAAPTIAPIRDVATTDTDGRWVNPLKLNSGLTYTVVVSATGKFRTRTFDIEVP